MPIRKELRWHYPIDWRELSQVVRFGRAGGRCEQCRRPHGLTIHHLGDGRWFDPVDELWRDGEGRAVEWVDYRDYKGELQRTKVVLATAHLDHDPGNNRSSNLKALCQRCHLRHDRQEHRRRTRITVLKRRALGDLLDGPYPYYPIDWQELSASVRFDRACGRCEQCRRPHGQTIHHLGDGRWFDPIDELWRDDQGQEIDWPAYQDYAALKKLRVVLATAHLDHDPGNNRSSNLKALCQRCHLRHDRKEHRRKTRITILKRRALGDLLDGPYPD